MKKVERSEDPEMIQRYGVQSFPTIILGKKRIKLSLKVNGLKKL